MRKSNPARPLGPNFSRAGGFTLGRDRFAQISAVEGIALTQEMRATLDHFDREGLKSAAAPLFAGLLRRFDGRDVRKRL
jgi:hypothetical protein